MSGRNLERSFSISPILKLFVFEFRLLGWVEIVTEFGIREKAGIISN